MNQEPNPGDLQNLVVDQSGIQVAPAQPVTELTVIGDLTDLPPAPETRTKRHFSYEEDNQIKALVEQHGTNQWALIAKSLNNRTARQVRDRWRCYLQPGVTKAEWTIDEDKTLIHLCQTIGKMWAQLVKFFPGRTDVDLKNHWNKLQRHAKKIQSSAALIDTPDINPIKLDAPELSAPIKLDDVNPPTELPTLQPTEITEPKQEHPAPQ